ncbi:MAG TPA: plastocyanin/azurin family copper-binding protein [Gemmatimonadales bacterium]
MTKHLLALGALGASLLLAACGGTDTAETQSAGQAAPTSSATSGAVTPDAGGRIIEVEMYTDENGNYFKPADFEAKKGDVIRFRLAQGVHNVHFLPDSNPGVANLPPMGPMLQLPGQTTDVKVEWEPGTYFYQCDPHALLGMVGHVTVVQ